MYSLVAYILSIDGVVKPDAVLDEKSLPAGEDAESRRLPELVGESATLSGAVANASQPVNLNSGLLSYPLKGYRPLIQGRTMNNDQSHRAALRASRYREERDLLFIESHQ